MIRRFVCLLLVPMLLANQGLSLAHSHLGTDVAAPEGHSSRPHIHVGGHHHHAPHDDKHAPSHAHKHFSDSENGADDHHVPLPSTIVPVGDHNADALYFAESVTLARGCDSSSDLLERHIVVATSHQTANPGDWRLRLGPSQYAASGFDAASPIYLRTHSLRI